MSDKQYRVARKGVVEQLKLAQRLHCKHMENTAHLIGSLKTFKSDENNYATETLVLVSVA